jgi:hypothetical protein
MLWLPFARVCFLPGASSFSGIGTVSEHLRSVNIIDALAWYGLGPRRAGALILRQFLPGHFRHDFPLHFQRNRNLSGQLFRITKLLSTSVLTISLPWFQSVSGPHRESLDYWDLDPSRKLTHTQLPVAKLFPALIFRRRAMGIKARQRGTDCNLNLQHRVAESCLKAFCSYCTVLCLSIHHQYI